MADYYYDDYLYTPTDGSAVIEPPYEGASNRVIKGGGFLTTFGSGKLRGFERDPYSENASQPDLGFRCARDVDGDDPDGGVDAGT